MDGQEYLNQIAHDDTRPKRATSSGFRFDFGAILKSKIFRYVVIGLGVLATVMIILSIVVGLKGNTREALLTFQLHVQNTEATLRDYQNNVKSPAVRSNVASLSSVLRGTNMSLTSYISTLPASDNELKNDVKLTEKAEEQRSILDDRLFEAKITGQLDWVISDAMAEEIYSILQEEDKLAERVKDSTVQSIIENNYESLINLYNAFNSYPAS